MKKTTLLIASAILIMALSSSAASAQLIENRNLTGFTKVSFNVPGNLKIHIGSEFKVVLEGDQDFLDEIETKVSDGELVIRRKNPNSYRERFINKKVIANITMPSVAGLAVAGLGKIEITDSFKAASLKLSTTGSGHITINDISCDNLDSNVAGSGGITILTPLKTGSLKISVSGSGHTTFNGISCETLECNVAGSGGATINGSGSIGYEDINISGSGNFSAKSVTAATADISVTGSGNCSCNVSENLIARVTGSGNITYIGAPKKMDTRVTGSGKVRSE
ncbi:MAG: DUF2807 domain-containing protein [Bacteroidales bacterium]|nr:DUF2807 domain-containing protein [Bacteroidales bacterium]